MKFAVYLVVLCALVATIAAEPAAWHQRKYHMQPRQTVMQRRMWLPAKWTLMRRSSNEGAFVEDTPAEVEALPEQIVDVEQPEAAAVESELELVEPEVTEEAAAAPDAAAAAAPSVPSFQPHTFFPMNFGQMGGATVAVANSFSTGQGSAYSHSVAHGSKAQQS